jgi:hypothetical protein
LQQLSFSGKAVGSLAALATGLPCLKELLVVIDSDPVSLGQHPGLLERITELQVGPYTFTAFLGTTAARFTSLRSLKLSAAGHVTPKTFSDLLTASSCLEEVEVCARHFDRVVLLLFECACTAQVVSIGAAPDGGGIELPPTFRRCVTCG